VEIKPEDKEDKGEHKVLVELVMESAKSFYAVEILVKLPLSYINSNLVPFFDPSLKDEIKWYGDSWKRDLSSIHDPVNMFARVS